MAVGAQPVEIDFGSLGAFLNAGRSGGVASCEVPDGPARSSQVPTSYAKRLDRGVNLGAARSNLPMMRPESDLFQDSAMLNRKVAFKMLKQLGCQVRTVEQEEDDGHASVSFIEVRQQVQPVLFQMLLEFGYQPFLTVDNVVAIRVEQARQRAKDEVFSALALPKTLRSPQKPVDDVGQPPQTKMSTQKEQEMVQRLYEKHASKAAKLAEAAEAEASDKAQRKYKSTAEQRAALDRLLRPRDAKETNFGGDQTLLPAPTSTSTSNLHTPRPAFGMRLGARARGHSADGDVRTFTSEVSSRSSAKLTKPSSLRQSPLLAQAAGFVLHTTTSSSSTSASDVSERQQTALGTDTAFVGTRSPTNNVSEEVTASLQPQASLEALGENLPQVVDRAPGWQQEGAVGEAQKNDSTAAPAEPESQSKDWIDSFLGPLQWPGRRAAARTRTEQQEHLKRLAKPRPPPLPQDPQNLPVPAPKRSPKTQMEACSRLAVPKVAQQPTFQPSETMPEHTDPRACEEEEEMDAENVVVIPSMLSQFANGLGRIDEDAPVDAAHPRRRPRSRSMPSASPAAPYAMPVVAASKINNSECGASSSSKASCRRRPRDRNAHHVDETNMKFPGCSLEQLLSDPDLVAEVVQDEIDESGVEGGEAMLAHIDRLYKSLLQGAGPAEEITEGAAQNSLGSEGKSVPQLRSNTAIASGATSTASQPLPRSLRGTGASASQPQKQQRGQRAPHQERQMKSQGPGRRAEKDCAKRTAEENQDEEIGLLANIDQLYNDIMNEDGSCSDKMGDTTHLLPPAVEEGKHVSQRVDKTGREREATKELSSALEEVLWSALLLKRGTSANVDVQSSLLELLPPRDLAQCFAACGPSCLSSSLLQRLSAEIPAVHTALTCMSPRLEGNGSKSIASLHQNVLEARDRLLILASTSCSASSSQMATPVAAATGSTFKEAEPVTKKTKARKSSLSHWTSESLTALEAPPRRLSQRLHR